MCIVHALYVQLGALRPGAGIYFLADDQLPHMILAYRRLILSGDAMRLALHLDLAWGVKIAMIRLEQQAPQCSRSALELGTIPIDARISFRYFPTQAPTLAPAIEHALMSLKK
jgi:hypothetical protein